MKDSIQPLIHSLHQCGIVEDEGPLDGGPCGPYIQSERLDLYHKYAQELVDRGHAYYCFCSTKRLEDLRQTQRRLGQATMYDRKCRHLTSADVQPEMNRGPRSTTGMQNYVIRLKVPLDSSSTSAAVGSTPPTTIAFKDHVRGYIQFQTSALDDQVLIKADGFPTYHFANVVDDHTMNISHVIRGEEWLTSTPKHILLYQMLGWKVPEFAHLGLLLNKHDRSKLSKRQGDVSVSDFIEPPKGEYISPALINFVALLGWNPGTAQELFSLKELEQVFRLTQTNKSGSVVDIPRLKWMNQHYLRLALDQSGEENAAFYHTLVTYLTPVYPVLATYSPERISSDLVPIFQLVRDKVAVFSDFVPYVGMFLSTPEYATDTQVKAVAKKVWQYPLSNLLLTELALALETLDERAFDQVSTLQDVCDAVLGTKSKKELYMPLRYALSGLNKGPNLIETMILLGQRQVLERIRTVLTLQKSSLQ